MPRAAASTGPAATGPHAVVTLPESGDVDELAAAMTEALEGPADVVVDPVFGWVAEAALPGHGAARSAGQPRRLRG